jgi:sugar fermentation stimulation protein A
MYGLLLMDLPPLTPGILIKRYQRFLADVQLADGRPVTAHCPNTGSMLGCCQPGSPVYLSRHDSPKRKLPFTWELIDVGSTLVGINTMQTNRIVKEALEQRAIPELNTYDTILAEVKSGRSSRIDFKLQGPDQPDCYLEVKNCTLVRNKTAAFPDAPSQRGRKHLLELESLAGSGYATALLLLVQRNDASEFRPADDIDPAYGSLLRRVASNGTMVLAYAAAVSLEKISLQTRIPVHCDEP